MQQGISLGILVKIWWQGLWTYVYLLIHWVALMHNPD
jgi:hypothetical protein